MKKEGIYSKPENEGKFNLPLIHLFKEVCELKYMNEFFLSGGRITDLEVTQRLVKIHKYCKANPSAKPTDVRMELFETDHMTRKYFRLVKAGEFDDIAHN